MKDRHTMKFKKMMSYKKDVRPSDLGVFPEDG